MQREPDLKRAEKELEVLWMMIPLRRDEEHWAGTTAQPT
jgi:hypothetical protein